MEHIDNLQKLVGDFNKKKILDVGSGDGLFLIECAKRGFDAVGIEYNPKKIEISEMAARKEGVHVSVQEGMAEQLPLPDDSFDFINIAEVIEHVQNPQIALKEVRRVLKLGGTAYISVHNRFGFFDKHFKVYFLGWMPRNLGEFYLKILRKHKDYKNMPDTQRISEMHYFTFRKFKILANSLGFTVIDTREEKINKKLFGFGRATALILYIYLRTLYFSTFHCVLRRQK